MPYSEKVLSFLRSRKLEVGDEIKIKADDVELEGFVLPREELEFGDPDVLLLKLRSGYNAGIRVDRISSVEKLAGRVELERFPKLKEIRQDESLPPISFISTGGTVSSRVDYLTGGVAMLFSPEELLYGIPELSGIVRVRAADRLFSLASEDMRPAQWAEISKRAVKLLSEGDRGVVVLHGTDTMHFTSAALSFMIKGINGPVVLTGAQRSPDRGSRDADLNVLSSARVAAFLPHALVCVVFHSSPSDDSAFVLRGTRLRKMHTSRRDAFRPINDLPVARVSRDGAIEVIQRDLKPRSDEAPWADPVFEEKVALLSAYPNSNPEVMDFLLDRGYRGFVLQGTGLGHMPVQTIDDKGSWLPAIRRAKDQGAFVGMTSQCIYGRVDQFVYRNGRMLAEAGVTFLGDMLSEVAYVKLCWLLGHDFDVQDVRKMMLFNFAGEISDGDNPETFLY